jgi:hypothetical protein
VDRRRFDADPDPDPTFLSDADLDPDLDWLQNNADPHDPTGTPSCTLYSVQWARVGK